MARTLAIVPGVLVLLILSTGAVAAPPQRLKQPGRPEPLPRIGEMLEWLAREQQIDGGWSYRLRLPLELHIHEARPRPSQSKNWHSKIPDTAMAGLALLRAGNTPEQGEYRKHVGKAADYLYEATKQSHPTSLDLAPSPTPFTARIGGHADTFLALLFFAELRGPRYGSHHGYDAAIRKLVEKVEKNQNADGSWGALEPLHAPVLGHALGVWALETAARHGVEVKPEVIRLAEQYAMSEAAEKNEWKANHRWKRDERSLKPKWMQNVQVDDDEPVNVERYLMAARLSVLYQADKTNQWQMSREVERLKAQGSQPTPQQLADLKAQVEAAKKTRETLERARDAMRKSWTTVHDRDVNASPGPVLFTAEDFLSSLLIVDAMASAADVQRWYPPTVRRVVQFQDMDGGLKTDQHVDCVPGCVTPVVCCTCKSRRGMDKQFCPTLKAWCSKDRTFITAAGVSMLLADTPYRPGFMGKAGAR